MSIQPLQSFNSNWILVNNSLLTSRDEIPLSWRAGDQLRIVVRQLERDFRIFNLTRGHSFVFQGADPRRDAAPSGIDATVSDPQGAMGSIDILDTDDERYD